MTNKSHITPGTKRIKKISTQHVRSDVLEHPIKLTDFDKVNAIDIEPVSETIADFIDRFNRVDVKSHTLQYYQKQPKTKQRDLKNGKCFSLAEYGNNKNGKLSLRNSANVKAMSGISIDIDNTNDGSTLTLKQVREVFQDYFTLIYTTHASSAKKIRLRLVMFFDQPIEADRYASVFEYCYQQLGEAVDTRAKDSARASFYPSCPCDQFRHYYYEVNDGQLFDTSIVPELVSNKVKKGNPQKQHNRKTTDCPTFKPINMDKIGVAHRVQSLICGGFTESHCSSRSEFAYKAMQELYWQKVGVENIFNIIADPRYEFFEHYSSFEAIWQDVERCIEKIKLNKYGIVHDIEAFYPEPDFQEPATICKAIRHNIQQYLQEQKNNCSTILAIKASAGIGKTEAVIIEMVEVVNRGGYVEVYLQSHKLAADVKKRIEAQKDFKGVVKILYGRESKNAGEGHCIKQSAAHSIAKSNITVSGLLCQDKKGKAFCTAYNECGYRKQYAQPAAIAIYVHQHLFMKRNSHERNKKPALIVIDESFWKAALDSTRIRFSSIQSLRVPAVIKEALRADSPYDYLADVTSDPSRYVKRELAKLKAEQLKIIATVKPNTLPDKALHLGQRIKKYNASIKLLETMLADYESINNHQPPLFLYLQKRKQRFASSEEQKIAWYCIEKRKPIERLYWEDEEHNKTLIPTVYIDADIEKEILSRFFEQFDYKAYYAKRRIKLWQLASATNARTELTKQGSTSLKSVQKDINHFAKLFRAAEATHDSARVSDVMPNKNVLIITYKELIDDGHINIPANCEPIYFGGYRGIDAYKHFDACIVIGRFQIPIDAIERYGIGLWHDAEAPLKLGNVVRLLIGYRLKGDKKLGVRVLFPADSRLQSVTRQLRECETLQGIDRLRVLHKKIRRPVLLLSNVPLDIDVDQLVFNPRSETKIDAIIRNAKDHVISLHPAVLYRDYPDFFKSKDDARQTVQRWKELYLDSNGCAYIFGCRHQQTQYKYNPKGGRSPYCLHKTSTDDETIIKRLKEIHGEECSIVLMR